MLYVPILLLSYLPCVFMFRNLYYWRKIYGQDKAILKHGASNCTAVIVAVNQKETDKRIEQKLISKQSIVYDVIVNGNINALFVVPRSERAIQGDSFTGNYYDVANLFVTSDFAKKNVAELKKRFLIFLLLFILGSCLQTAIKYALEEDNSYNNNKYNISQPHTNTYKTDKKDEVILEPWKTVNIQGVSYTVPARFVDKYPDDSMIDSYQPDYIGLSVILFPAEGMPLEQIYEAYIDDERYFNPEKLSTEPINGLEHIEFKYKGGFPESTLSTKIDVFAHMYAVPGGICLITYVEEDPNTSFDLDKLARSITSDGTPITVPPGYWEENE